MQSGNSYVINCEVDGWIGTDLLYLFIFILIIPNNIFGGNTLPVKVFSHLQKK